MTRVFAALSLVATSAPSRGSRVRRICQEDPCLIGRLSAGGRTRGVGPADDRTLHEASIVPFVVSGSHGLPQLGKGASSTKP